MDLRSYLNESCSHSHNFAQVVLPLSGSMELEAGDYSGIVNHDLGVYIAPNEPHCFAGSDHNLFVVVDVLHPNLVFEQSKSRAFTLSPHLRQFLHFTQHYLTGAQEDSFSFSLMNQLLLHFATESFSPGFDSVAMKAKNWIDAHFTQPVDIKKIAQFCYLSASQLQRRFKQALGMSLGEYWRFKKLNHAKHLLSLNSYSIEAVAYAVGYENLPAFSRRFNQMFGESPTQWRTKALSAKKLRETDNFLKFAKR